ncbi:hypothetical protein C5471_08490 [Photorhabdus tasmaniensis]|uniref:Uncharacterized protein n=1 Tax=Photorhabdus tasmaniensis TaxID=1004159 RepID=A0ABX0GF32_9GAMM|nr:hypothetical protein [Photorhabdus tasmaniensis]
MSSVSIVAGQPPFNIMWHYAKAGLNGPPTRNKHYVGAAHRRALRGHLGPGARLAAGLSFLAREAHWAAPTAVSLNASAHRRSRRHPWRLRCPNLP